MHEARQNLHIFKLMEKKKNQILRKQVYQKPVQISKVFVGSFLLPTSRGYWKQKWEMSSSQHWSSLSQ